MELRTPSVELGTPSVESSKEIDLSYPLAEIKVGGKKVSMIAINIDENSFDSQMEEFENLNKYQRISVLYNSNLLVKEQLLFFKFYTGEFEIIFHLNSEKKWSFII